MEKIQTGILIGHTLVALIIIALVLLQRGKGADAGAAFGSGASGTVFGSRGSGSFFSRMTAVLATVFFASSLTLAYLSSQRTTGPESLLESAPAVETEEPAAEPVDEEGLPELPTMDDTDDVPAGDELPELPADEPTGEATEDQQ